jgi:hypothetical protein
VHEKNLLTKYATEPILISYSILTVAIANIGITPLLITIYNYNKYLMTLGYKSLYLLYFIFLGFFGFFWYLEIENGMFLSLKLVEHCWDEMI